VAFNFAPDMIPAAKLIAAAVDRNTAAIDRLNATLETNGKNMTASVQALVDEVAATRDVEASVLKLIDGFLAKLDAAAGDQASIDKAVQDLKEGRDPMAAAVVANTPAAPPA
jgi:hypothetical protein